MSIEKPSRKTPGLLSVIQSTAAAAFGVQSSRKREKDFTTGQAGPFIIAGVVFTVLFVLGLLYIANKVAS